MLGWTPDGKQILFNAHRTPYSDRNARPYLVPAAGGMETPLAIREGSAGVLSPDGNRFVFAPSCTSSAPGSATAAAAPRTSGSTTSRTNTAEQITDDPAIDYMPVWIGDTVYFVSDRDKGRHPSTTSSPTTPGPRPSAR